MVSTKGRYAIRLMIDLLEQKEGTPIPLDDIARRQGISKKYLETVVRLLVGAKLVKGSSGKGGGYTPLRKAEEYKVLEILNVTEGTMAPVACLECDAEACPRKDSCKTLPMWKRFDSLVSDFFDGITIADLINGNIQ